MKCSNCGTEMKLSENIQYECPKCGCFGYKKKIQREQKQFELAEFVFKELMRKEIIPGSKQIAEMSVRYAENFLDRVDKMREEKREKETGEEIQRQSTAESTIDFPEKREKDNRPVTERIHDMEDVLAELGPDHPLVVQYRHYLETTEPGQRDDYLATFMQLRMVTEAINEGWHPEYNEDEAIYGYVPVIYLYKTLEDAVRCKYDDEIVVEIPEAVRCVLLGGSAAIRGASAGLAYAYSRSAPSLASALVGSRLCFQTSELAKHAAQNFAELWIKFYFM